MVTPAGGCSPVLELPPRSMRWERSSRASRASVGIGAKRRLSGAGSQELLWLTAAEPLALQSQASAAGGLDCGRRG